MNINYNLLTKYLANETNPEENNEVKDWLERDINNQNEFEEIKKTWNLFNNTAKIDQFDVEQSLKQVKKKLKNSSETKVFILKPLLKMAAAILFIITIGLTAFYFINNPLKNTIALSSNEGIVTKILPDGTTIILNANTALKYNVTFNNNKTRKVWLNGEAYFNVKPNKSKPFIIETNNSIIKVLGTSFNVKAYKNSERSTVSVNSGIVEFSRKSIFGATNDKLLLENNSEGILNNSKKEFIKQEIDSNYLSWKTKRIIFTKTTLNEVKNVLESVYQVNLIFNNKELENLRLTATFDNDDIKTVINVIEITFNIKAEFTEDKIIFSI